MIGHEAAPVSKGKPGITPARSRAETFAAGTTAGGIGVLDLETAALKRVRVIQFASGDVERALGINDHSDAAGLNQDVAIRRAVLQIHFVPQRATPPGDGLAWSTTS